MGLLALNAGHRVIEIAALLRVSDQPVSNGTQGWIFSLPGAVAALHHSSSAVRRARKPKDPLHYLRV
jgi:hypothetical protein